MQEWCDSEIFILFCSGVFLVTKMTSSEVSSMANDAREGQKGHSMLPDAGKGNSSV